MNYLKTLFKISFFILVFNVYAAETVFNDVAILLDVTFEKPDSKSPVITRDLAFTVCQKNYPIITTSNLLLNFLSIKSAKKEDNEYHVQILKVDFNLKDWEIYKTKEGNFYLLIPSNAKKAGFQIDSLEKVNLENQTIDTLLQSIKSTQIINIEELQRMFLQSKDEKFGLWNIYLVGHGMYPEKLEKSLIEEKEKHFYGAAIEQDISGSKITGLDITQFRSLIQFFTNKINVNFLYYMTCYGGDNNLILPYVTKIVGEVVLKVGEEEKKVTAIKYTTKPNFTIVAGSLTSKTVLAAEDVIASCINKNTAKEVKEEQEKQQRGGKLDIAKFFKLLHVAHKGVARIIYKKDELQEILKAVTIRNTQREDPYGLSGLPSVMFPGTDKFTLFPVNDKIIVLTDVAIAQYQDVIIRVLRRAGDPEAKSKPINLIDKEAILIYSEIIPVDINIEVKQGKPAPAIVSMIPGISLHQIKKLSINVPFSEFIYKSFGTVTTEFTKNYYIKELRILNDEFTVESKDKEITLNNVLISQTSEKVSLLEKHPIKIFLLITI